MVAWNILEWMDLELLLRLISVELSDMCSAEWNTQKAQNWF